MKSYSYLAKDRIGQDIKGVVESDTRAVALEKITALGLMAITVTELRKKPSVSDAPFFTPRNISMRQLAVFTNQFSVLIGAGVPVLDSLGVLHEQTERGSLRRMLSNIQQQLRNGVSLPDSFEKYRRDLPPSYVDMLRVAEASGELDVVLKTLASDIQKQYETNQKVKTAMAYPKFAATVVLCVVVFMLAFIMPRFASMYSQAGAKLPGLTLAVIGISAVIRKWWLLLAAIVFLLVIGMRMLMQVHRIRSVVDRISLKMPIIGGVLYYGSMTRFARSTAMLLASGINVLRAISLASRTLQNAYLEDSIPTIVHMLEDGFALSASVKAAKVFPPMLVRMITVGEESGKVDDVLTRLASMWEEDLDQHIRQLSSKLEPAMIVVLGFVVGVIAIAMYLPMFGMAQVVSK